MLQKQSVITGLDDNMVLREADALRMDKSAAAESICGCASIHFQSFGISQRHIVV